MSSTTLLGHATQSWHVSVTPLQSVRTEEASWMSGETSSRQSILIQPVTLISVLHTVPWFAFQYLSEDEAGGGGAAIRPLETAPPGISPSIHLCGNGKILTSSFNHDRLLHVYVLSLYCVSKTFSKVSAR